MDAKHTLMAFKEELEADKKEHLEIAKLLKVSRAAGEDVAALEQNERDILASINRWEKAIDAGLK